jgi:hypothetical protein
MYAYLFAFKWSNEFKNDIELFLKLFVLHRVKRDIIYLDRNFFVHWVMSDNVHRG